MAEWNLPFDPPPRQAEEAVAQVTREWDKTRFLTCSHCGEPIDHGEQCMEFIPGVSGFGARSGQPMIVDCDSPEHEHAHLHIGCIYDYVFQLEETLDYHDDEPKFCAGCEARLSGDEG